MKHLLLVLLLPLASLAQSPAASPASNASDDLSKYTTGDALWTHIQTLKQGPNPRPATAGEYQAAVTTMMGQMYSASTEFLKRYPDDPRKWDARLLQMQLNSTLNRINGHMDEAGDVAKLRQLAGETDAPASARSQARVQLIGISLHDYMAGDKGATSADVLAQLKQFAVDFPGFPATDTLKYQVAQALDRSDPAAANTLLQDLAAHGQGRAADQARKELDTRQKLKSPLDLHFTAVDGSPVDLSSMRGKVVLVDFWATWCGPCRAELPDVLAAYKKLHDKGFEIVGISLDQDKDALVKYTADNGMTWPQYFDGKGWENAISAGFGIQSIPTMWLVNKRGYVVSTDGRTNLAGQVEQLLAE